MELKGPVTVEIAREGKTRVVHMNRIRQIVQPSCQETPPPMVDSNNSDWSETEVDHEVVQESQDTVLPTDTPSELDEPLTD